MVYTHAAAAAVALAVGFGAGWKVQGWRWGAERAESLSAAQEAAHLARRAEQAAQERADANARALALRSADLDRRAALARSDADSLRHQLASLATGTASSPECPGSGDGERVRVLSGLLAEGVGLAQEGAERVDRLDARVTALQQHALALAGATAAGKD